MKTLMTTWGAVKTPKHINLKPQSEGGVFTLDEPLEFRWVVYGPENGYNFPYSSLLRVNENLELASFKQMENAK